MAQDKKISELSTYPVTLTGTEQVVLVQSGTTYKGTLADLRAYILSLDIETDGSVFMKTVGQGLEFKSGVTQRTGNATLVAGTVTVANSTITANTIVLLTRKTIGGIAGNLTYTIAAASGFTINSTNGADTSVVSYLLIELV